MRAAAALFLLAACAFAQFKSTVPLVVAPTTVKDTRGHYIDGLTTADLSLSDDNVPQSIQMDWMVYPISLVVVVQASANSGAILDKLGGSGILFTQLLAGDAGETAVVSFSDRIQVDQDFTDSPDAVIHALRMLRKEGENAHILDAIGQALAMLERRPAGRRRIILMIAERRDRGSRTALADIVERTQKLNAAVYWLTWSPFLQPFTVKPKRAEDLKPEAERIKMRACTLCPAPDDTPVPPDLGPGGYFYAISELFRLRRPDLSALFTSTTGGTALGFLTKNALEKTIQLAGEEVHRQYILTFQPKSDQTGWFHRIRVTVKDRPELEVKARAGYWAVQ